MRGCVAWLLGVFGPLVVGLLLMSVAGAAPYWWPPAATMILGPIGFFGALLLVSYGVLALLGDSPSSDHRPGRSYGRLEDIPGGWTANAFDDVDGN